jgi:hypothetical protein
LLLMVSLPYLRGGAEEGGAVHPLRACGRGQELVGDVVRQVRRVLRHRLEERVVEAVLVVLDVLALDGDGVLEEAGLDGQLVGLQVLDLADVDPLAHAGELLEHGHVNLAGAGVHLSHELGVGGVNVGLERVQENPVVAREQGLHVGAVDIHGVVSSRWLSGPGFRPRPRSVAYAPQVAVASAARTQVSAAVQKYR